MNQQNHCVRHPHTKVLHGLISNIHHNPLSPRYPQDVAGANASTGFNVFSAAAQTARWPAKAAVY